MTFTSRLRTSLLIAGLAVTLPAALAAQELSALPLRETPPDALGAPLRPLVGDEGTRVTTAGAVLDFWWVKSLALSGTSGAPAWAQVTEGALVGVVRLTAPWPDIRGRTIKPGVYTLRYGIQPANGDHLGVSPFRDFLLLSPADVDQDPALISHDRLAELSSKAVGSTHPAVLSLDPPVATEEPLKTRANEAGHTAVIFQVPVSRDDAPAGTLRFGLILIGKIEA